jgi:hypothetical protein
MLTTATAIDITKLDPEKVVRIDLGDPEVKKKIRTRSVEWAKRDPFYVPCVRFVRAPARRLGGLSRPRAILDGGAQSAWFRDVRQVHGLLKIAVERLTARFPEARLADSNMQLEYGGSVGELKICSLPIRTS